ncbi:MAG: ribosome biogenesis GTPase Der [Bdellovibrionota bacterium]
MSSRKNNGPKSRKEPELTSATSEPLFKAHRDVSRVAIIGRPNVGKSTLFNYLTSSRRAVVKDQPGVTRDILIEPADVWGHKFDLIDTGGLTEAKDLFSKLIREQVVDFLRSVDHLIVVMDGREGLHTEDRDIIRIAKEAGKPFLLVLNKVDKIHAQEEAKNDFYELGFDMVAASFEQRYGMDEVLEWIAAQISRTENTVREGLTLAMVGKPNVGKSSLCNRLLGEKRLLVSEIAGTTTDSVDTELMYEGRKYILIDTAGLRRSAKVQQDLEIISTFKTRDAIRRADITLLVVDGNEGPTSQDAKILEQILKAHRAVILVANKVDIAEEARDAYRSWFRSRVETEFHFFPDLPIVFTSAVTGKGLKDMFDTIVAMEDKIKMRITTRKLNDFFINTIRQAPAPVWGIQNVKFYYLTQTNQQPPAFIAFANHPDGVSPSYRRFVAKRLQEEFGLKGVPIRIFVMSGSHGQRRKMPALDEAIESAESTVNDAVEGEDFAYEADTLGFKAYAIEDLEKMDQGARVEVIEDNLQDERSET